MNINNGRGLGLVIHLMFVPITSEVTIKSGLVLKEISTDMLFEVRERVKDKADTWEVREVAPDQNSKIETLENRQTMSMKFLAEVPD